MTGVESAAASTLASAPAEVLLAALPEAVPAWIVAVTLLPLALVLLTAFARISIILAFLRQGLGLQEVPSATVTTGLAALLSMVAMAPVLDGIHREVLVPHAAGELSGRDAALRMWHPLSGFMAAQTRPGDVALFRGLLAERGVTVAPGDFQVTVPAFVLSELKSGFQIGLVVWLPFLLVDLLVGILLSLTALNLEVRTVALPAKLFLFVAVDGWTLLVGSMVRSFAGGP